MRQKEKKKKKKVINGIEVNVSCSGKSRYKKNEPKFSRCVCASFSNATCRIFNHVLRLRQQLLYEEILYSVSSHGMMLSVAVSAVRRGRGSRRRLRCRR
jgi:hypothetical protein